MTTMLKSPEVAERVGVSEDTLKRWRRRSTRSQQLIGPPWMRTETGQIRYPADALENWIKNRTVVA